MDMSIHVTVSSGSEKVRNGVECLLLMGESRKYGVLESFAGNKCM